MGPSYPHEGEFSFVTSQILLQLNLSLCGAVAKPSAFTPQYIRVRLLSPAKSFCTKKFFLIFLIESNVARFSLNMFIETIGCLFIILIFIMLL